MATMWKLAAGTAVAVLCAIGIANAQGLQTGLVSGTVTSSDGLPLPGASVTVASQNLQGTRTTVTDVNGNYVIRGLPPGDYTVTFELTGMATRSERTVVALGRTTTLDAELAVAAVAESIEVVAESSPVVANPVVGANFKATEINRLPSGRTPQQIAELAPGLTDNTPNTEQLAISGGFAFDNVFLVDGVDVNDNFFASPNDLYIEDAVDETQVLTSGISAEYGRFTGGVVNLVTKRGGNRFSGSFRTNFQNPSWTDETPFETTPRRDDLQTIFEGTLGGPIVQDQLWFFLAGRSEETETPYNFVETGIPGQAGVDDKRLETKLTATLAKNHTVQGSYVHNDTAQTGVRGINSQAVDPAVLYDRQIPQRLYAVNWNGVLSSRVFATAQWSQKKYRFENSGGTGTRMIDSPFRTLGVTGIPQSRLYNAPYFDGNDPEDRDNRQLTGSVSYFLSSKSGGSHDIKGGVEWFRSINTGGNGQSPTGYVFYSDYIVDEGGVPVFNADGRLTPQFIPGGSWLFNWISAPGARINIDTTSLYLHDRWAAGRRFTFDMGLRYERVRSEATGDIVGADSDTWVPRLAATYDVKGDGRLIAQATYGHYSGRYTETTFASNTEVGNPSLVIYDYTGPEGQGLDFAPGLDPANYTDVLFGSFGTANVFIEDGLTSPITREFTASLGTELGSRGHVKVTWVQRKTTSIIDDFITADQGTTEVIRDGVNFGVYDNIVYRNAPSDLFREYRAMVFQGRYRLSSRWEAAGHYTLQVRQHGNFEGEAANQPGVPSFYADYPETTDPDRITPYGRLASFQRHKLRLWTIYNVDLGPIGGIDAGAIWRYNSGLSYSLAAEGVPVTDEQIAIAEAAGYANTPLAGEQDLYFGARGSESFDGYGLFDLGLTYSIPVWRSLRPYLKFDVLNVFNDQTLIAFDTTVVPVYDGPVDALGLPTTFERGPRFGEATANTDYPGWRTGENGGRTFLLAFGFRF